MGKWWQVLTLFLSAGVFTAIVNNLLAEWRDRKKEKRTSTRDALYSAMRVAVILEKFAIECEDILTTTNCIPTPRVMPEPHTGSFRLWTSILPMWTGRR